MHDHAHHSHAHAEDPARAVLRAEELCARSGARLTPIRARVLEVLAASQQPLGAYDLIERLDIEGRRPAPITVYRALDFLLAQGLVHRIESRNAFVACDHTHDQTDVVVFLLCERCGAASEACGLDVGSQLRQLAGGVGFEARAQVIEIAGICQVCRAAA
jgi:Fur family transcriptional regulator, zinc uptake regulator